MLGRLLFSFGAAALATGCVIRDPEYPAYPEPATVWVTPSMQVTSTGYPIYYGDGGYWAYRDDGWYLWSTDHWMHYHHGPHSSIVIAPHAGAFSHNAGSHYVGGAHYTGGLHRVSGSHHVGGAHHAGRSHHVGGSHHHH